MWGMRKIRYVNGGTVFSQKASGSRCKILALVLLAWDRVRGLQTSGVLFVFWLTLGLAGVAQFLTEIEQLNLVVDNMYSAELKHKIVMYIAYYPSVVLMLVLNMFADPPPRITDYPKHQKICPEVQASFASRVIFGWYDRMIWQGFRKTLTFADLWDLRYQDSTVQVEKRFEENWRKYNEKPEICSRLPFTVASHKTMPYLRWHSNKELYVERDKKTVIDGNLPKKEKVQKKRISIFGIMCRTCWISILASAITKLIGDAVSFVNPQILLLMIRFVDSKEFMWRGFVYSVALFVMAELQTLFSHHHMMSMFIVGLNCRTSIMSAIYKKGPPPVKIHEEGFWALISVMYPQEKGKSASSVKAGKGSSSSMGWPIAMHLSLKGLLCIPEAYHEDDQSMVSAVLQTAESNQSGQAKPKQPSGGGCKSRRARRITLFAPTAHSLSQYPLCVECEYECVLVVIWLFVVLCTVLWSVSCGSISVSELREWYK
ncbi:Canalicular multispecific organic anion transporter 1 [Homalodisca vitripennis]|nr:Canalicular multispecific organic anion transporter 1 [Homalodisca vitripennis]